jgi:hypothetical protein
VEISVRDLLTLWTAKSRGHRISQRIEADLTGRMAADRALSGPPLKH